jgi:ABC-type multidrug transport system fused ATPase/permease subunit
MTIIGKALKISFVTQSRVSLIIRIAGFLTAFLPILISKTLKHFTDQVQSLYSRGVEQFALVLGTFAVLAALYIVQLLYSSLQSYYAEKDTINVQAYIKETILRCSCRVQYKYIENYNDFKEKISFAETYAGYRVAQSMQSITTWIQNLIAFLSIVYVLFEVNGWIVAALIATSVPAVILAYLQKDEDYRLKTKWMKEGALVIHYFHDCCNQRSLNEVRFFGLFEFLKGKWRTSANHYIAMKNKMTKVHVLYNSIADILRSSVYIVILFIVAKEIFDNPAVGLGAFMLVLTLAGQMQEVTAKLFIHVAYFISDVKYMKDFFKLDNMEQEKLDDESVPLDKADICFHNVEFSYPGSTYRALNELNIMIKQGEKVAIVGENGSGKTTFVNLLCGMYEPDRGTISVNGQSITEKLSTVRRSLSAVFQDFGKYEASIRENITVSDNRKRGTDEELQTLSEQTEAFDFIKDQPHQFDKVIGSFHEDGNNLSGGQWQKLAITRAAYRDKARIMVLDEPTAALDPVAEEELYRNFSKLTGDKTTILVSHRLGIASIVDRVLVFDQGQIVEDGSHTSLILRNGIYAKMYRSQAEFYN